jgi:hypothetical protein
VPLRRRFLGVNLRHGGQIAIGWRLGGETAGPEMQPSRAAYAIHDRRVSDVSAETDPMGIEPITELPLIYRQERRTQIQCYWCGRPVQKLNQLIEIRQSASFDSCV